MHIFEDASRAHRDTAELFAALANSSLIWALSGKVMLARNLLRSPDKSIPEIIKALVETKKAHVVAANKPKRATTTRAEAIESAGSGLPSVEPSQSQGQQNEASRTLYLPGEG